ncbi:PilZ domain-containing protein [Rhodovastum atsumiense]|uniref:PilZ domain-containing protein n=1 Tax=Rhodovastum atsumiense TaxID=504468 RepID=A0A5M6IPF3_9PROT|nr:PilZ domain-containing protein [Rhodovastum atsumiense]CAH2599244.1 PilZ domain-containing protein [Rhodovastum atsumiense]
MLILSCVLIGCSPARMIGWDSLEQPAGPATPEEPMIGQGEARLAAVPGGGDAAPGESGEAAGEAGGTGGNGFDLPKAGQVLAAMGASGAGAMLVVLPPLFRGRKDRRARVRPCRFYRTSNRRQAARILACPPFRVGLADIGGKPRGAQVENVSLGGAALHWPGAPLRPGTRTGLILDGMVRMDAVVVACEDNVLRLRFSPADRAAELGILRLRQRCLAPVR